MTAGFLQMCAEKLLRKRKNESWAMSRAVQCCDRFEMPVAPCHLQFSRTHSVRTCRHTSPTLGVGGNLYDTIYRLAESRIASPECVAPSKNRTAGKPPGSNR